MKTHLLRLVVLGSGWILLIASLVAEPAPRPRLTEELRQRVEAAASATEKSPPAPSDNDHRATVLAPLKITEKFIAPLFRPDEHAPVYHPFTWKDGGTFYRHRGRRITTELKFDYNPTHGGIDLLSFSW